MIECPPCNEKLWPCIDNHGQVGTVCAEDFQEAVSMCGPPSQAGLQPITCDNQDADTSGSWDPGQYITFDSGTYYVDEAFFDWLRDNPDQLLHDGARVEWKSPYFEFDDVRSGDFVEALGFADGDKLVEINNNPLDTFARVVTAVNNVSSASEFYVEINRPGIGLMTLHYVLD